jgi:hypothetical protein
MGNHDEAVVLFSAKSSVFASEEDPACVGLPSRGGAGADNSESSVECFELGDILSGQAITSTEQIPRREEGTVVGGWGESMGLAPDGVASIVAEFANGTKIEVPVTENFFKFDWDPVAVSDHPYVEPEGGASLGDDEASGTGDIDPIGPVHTVWRDADGNVIPQQPAG